MTHLADRDAARKQVKHFYLAMRRNGATPGIALRYASEHARKLGVANPGELAGRAQRDIDPEVMDE